MKTFKKTLRIFLQVLPYLFFAIAALLIFDVVSALRNQETPTVFGYGAAIVLSPSMEDTIMTGDLIVYRKTDPSTLEIGDIITFWKPGAEVPVTITHRIVDIDESGGILYFTTKGDNNNVSESWETGFPETQVIGVFVAKSTAVGWVYSRLYSLFENTGIAIVYPFIILVFLLIGVSEGRSIVKELSAAKKKELEAEKARLVAEELEKLRGGNPPEEPRE